MRKWLIAIVLAVLPSFAFGASFHGHMGGGRMHGGPAFHGSHVFHGGRAFHGGHFARFDHRFGHFRHGRNFAFFAAAPFIVGSDYCWRWVRTPYGLRRAWVCGDDYGYYGYW